MVEFWELLLVPSGLYRVGIAGAFFDFMKGSFHWCINNVISYVWVVAPDASFERITEAFVMAEFST